MLAGRRSNRPPTASEGHDEALVEEDLKPEFKLKVAEWEVQKAMAGHSNRVRRNLTVGAERNILQVLS